MKRREAITYMSSFVVAYGTRDGMKSYEYSDVSVSQVCPFSKLISQRCLFKFKFPPGFIHEAPRPPYRHHGKCKQPL